MLFRFNKFFSLILLTFFVITQATLYVNAEPIQPGNPPALEIATPSAILIDAKTGQILYAKNIDNKMYPASITKIMTAVIALENGNLQSTIKMSRRSVMELERGSSNVGLLEGEELTLDQLLHALLLESANEAANAIAEALAGSKEEFAKKMTQRAKELGAKNTNFANPHGLHNPDHYTTAYDMAMIAKHAMTIPKFREIVGTKTYTLPPTNKMPKEKILHNKNKLLNPTSGYYYPYAIGVKTGYTVAAGSTLVSAANKNGVELIAVVLNSPIEGYRPYMYIDSLKLYKYGFENFVSYKMVSKTDVLDNVKVKSGSSKVTAVPQNDFSVLLPNGVDKNTVKITKHIDSNLRAPLKKGDVIGYISFDQNGVNFGKVNVVSNNDVRKSFFSFLGSPKEKSFLSILWFIIKWLFIIAVSLVLGFILYAVAYNYYRKIVRKRSRLHIKIGDQ